MRIKYQPTVPNSLNSSLTLDFSNSSISDLNTFLQSALDTLFPTYIDLLNYSNFEVTFGTATFSPLVISSNQYNSGTYRGDVITQILNIKQSTLNYVKSNSKIMWVSILDTNGNRLYETSQSQANGIIAIPSEYQNIDCKLAISIQDTSSAVTTTFSKLKLE